VKADPVHVGLLGCGTNSGRYLEAAAGFPAFVIVACGDLMPERALGQAVTHGVGRVHTIDEILADEHIEVVLNVTQPAAHAGINRAILHAGKSVYSDKPLSAALDEGQTLLDTAAEKNLRIGCAPDTFLGAGLQTARKLIDEGAIGQPVAAAAFLGSREREQQSPQPDTLYGPGAGPLLDAGPYYVTTLIHLLGPVTRVAGATRMTGEQRTIATPGQAPRQVAVKVPTHAAGVLEFACGTIATLVTSYDIWHTAAPALEVHGSKGTLRLPDPCTYGGPVLLRATEDADWREIPLAFANDGDARGIGLADMAHAMRSGRAHRASGQLAFHVLDVLHALETSARDGIRQDLDSTCERPAPLPTGLWPGKLDD
jgi:predicted dehydrogenase